MRDPELYRFIPGEPPSTVEALAARYARMAGGPRSRADRWYNWAVSLRGESATAFGTVELTIVGGGARAFLAYAVARECWGHGYAYEACGAALAFLRANTSVGSVWAAIDTRNERSIALVERLGFTRRATVEDADHFKGSTSHEFHYCLALRE